MKNQKTDAVCGKVVQNLGLGLFLGCQLPATHQGRCKNDRSNLPGAKPSKAQTRRAFGPVFIQAGELPK